MGIVGWDQKKFTTLTMCSHYSKTTNLMITGFETATPTFLVDTLSKRDTSLDKLSWTIDKHELLSSFDIDHMPVEALLFQTGYVTITGSHGNHVDVVYELDYPNREVRQSLNKTMLRHLIKMKALHTVKRAPLQELLDNVDAKGLLTLFSSFLEKIPYLY